MGRKKRHLLILDANILIDFYKCDRTIVKLICTYVGRIYLATPVLNEINQIDERDCLELGMCVALSTVHAISPRVLCMSARLPSMPFGDTLRCPGMVGKLASSWVLSTPPLQPPAPLMGPGGFNHDYRHCYQLQFPHQRSRMHIAASPSLSL